MLVGRDRECARLDRVLRGARAGEAKVLVLLGEPGIGKTALLDHAAARREGMTVVRAVGLESEARARVLGAVRRLPAAARITSTSFAGRQADGACRTRLGIGSGAARRTASLVGAATLSLLAAAAEDAPLLVLRRRRAVDRRRVDRRAALRGAAAGRRARGDGRRPPAPTTPMPSAPAGSSRSASAASTTRRPRRCWRRTASADWLPTSSSSVCARRRAAARSRWSSCRGC